MRLEHLLAYLDGRLPEPERAGMEAYLATAEGRQARQALGLLRRTVRETAATGDTCDRLEETCALAEGDLEGEARLAAETHLLSCPACFQAYCDLQQPLPAAAPVPQAVLDRVLEPRTLATIIPMPTAQRELPTSAASRAAQRWWKGGAAGLAVAAVLIAVVWHPSHETGYDLPAGPGAAGTGGHAMTTSIATSREGNAATMSDKLELAAKESPEQRINTLLQELQQSQDNTAARWQLAQLYERLGKKALAIKHYHLLQAALLRQGHVGGRAYTDTERRLQALE